MVAARRPLIVATAATSLVAGVWLGLPDLPVDARATLTALGLAIIAWVGTSLDDTWVALAATAGLAASGTLGTDALFGTLGHGTIWLLLAAFVIAAAVTACGLVDRAMAATVARLRTSRQLFYGLTGAIGLTAFMVPSTSGRAALLLPVFTLLAARFRDARMTVALALLFPAAILLSAAASLTGAGAHLVTAELIGTLTGERIDFARWAVLGVPFAVASCLVTTFTIRRLFLDPARRAGRIPAGLLATAGPRSGWTRSEATVAATVAALVVLWSTESLHGLDAALVALIGAVVVTAPGIGAISLKAAMKKVEWGILLFMAATLALSEALVSSGAADWLASQLLAVPAAGPLGPRVMVTALVLTVSLLAHLVITSRTARSSVLVPLVILLATAHGLDPAALAFLSTVAAGFCLTLTVSAKPVLLFSRQEGETFRQRDLLTLSTVLIPAHLLLLVVFALWIYPLFGLDVLRP